MGNADFNDGDAMAAATDEVRRKEREAIEKEAARKVSITVGQVRLILRALRSSHDFAGRFVNVKEMRQRVDAQIVVKQSEDVIPLLEAKESAPRGRGPTSNGMGA